MGLGSAAGPEAPAHASGVTALMLTRLFPQPGRGEAFDVPRREIRVDALGFRGVSLFYRIGRGRYANYSGPVSAFN